MPELASQSTAPATPPPPSGPAVSPPVIRPEEFEDFPVFRETFLLMFTDARANAAMREYGRLQHELVLEFWGHWPDHPEGIFRASLRAAIADLRHVQGALLEWSDPDANLQTPHEEHLARVARTVGREMGTLGDRLEEELGHWRGEVDA